MKCALPQDVYGCELIEPATNPALNYAQRQWDDDYVADFFIDNDLIAQYDAEHSREGATLPATIGEEQRRWPQSWM